MPQLRNCTRLDAGLEKWLFMTARQNYWRVARIHEFEDVVQIGYQVYAKLRRKYPDVQSQAHFMALFQTAFINKLHGLADKNRIYADGSTSALDQRGERNVMNFSALFVDQDQTSMVENIVGSCEQEGPLRVLVRQARGPVKQVLDLFTTRSGVRFLREHPRKRREPLNRYLCRLIGADPSILDLPSLILSFFSGQGMYYLRVHGEVGLAAA